MSRFIFFLASWDVKIFLVGGKNITFKRFVSVFYSVWLYFHIFLGHLHFIFHNCFFKKLPIFVGLFIFSNHFEGGVLCKLMIIIRASKFYGIKSYFKMLLGFLLLLRKLRQGVDILNRKFYKQTLIFFSFRRTHSDF